MNALTCLLKVGPAASQCPSHLPKPPLGSYNIIASLEKGRQFRRSNACKVSSFFNLMLHVRRVIAVWIDTSLFDVKYSDLIGKAGGQNMFFLYCFHRLALAKLGRVQGHF